MRKSLTAGNKGGSKGRSGAEREGTGIDLGEGLHGLAGSAAASQGFNPRLHRCASQPPAAERGCFTAGQRLGGGRCTCAAVNCVRVLSKGPHGRGRHQLRCLRWSSGRRVRAAACCAAPLPQPPHDNLPAVPSVMSVITAGRQKGRGVGGSTGRSAPQLRVKQSARGGTQPSLPDGEAGRWTRNNKNFSIKPQTQSTAGAHAKSNASDATHPASAARRPYTATA